MAAPAPRPETRGQRVDPGADAGAAVDALRPDPRPRAGEPAAGGGAWDVRLRPGDRPAQPHPQRNPRRACHRPAPHRRQRGRRARGSRLDPLRDGGSCPARAVPRRRGRGRSQRHPPTQPGSARAVSRPPTCRLAPNGRGSTPGTASISRASRSKSRIRWRRSISKKRRPHDAAGAPVRRFPRAAPEIALSEGGHLGYAVQWFAFAGILLGGYALLFHQRAKGT